MLIGAASRDQCPAPVISKYRLASAAYEIDPFVLDCPNPRRESGFSVEALISTGTWLCRERSRPPHGPGCLRKIRPRFDILSFGTFLTGGWVLVLQPLIARTAASAEGYPQQFHGSSPRSRLASTISPWAHATSLDPASDRQLRIAVAKGT